MEYGPRALGNRSILGDASSPSLQKDMNLKIKYRESFRPFAPSVMKEDAVEYFDFPVESPYMLMTAPVRKEIRLDADKSLSGFEKLQQPLSKIPAVTHVDYSARLQTVDKETNPRFWKILEEMKRIKGLPLVINTSFNVRGEPIVCTPQDAFDCFMGTEMDVLVIGNYILYKEEQPESLNAKREFKPD
jgi:carbamoyltransferase